MQSLRPVAPRPLARGAVCVRTLAFRLMRATWPPMRCAQTGKRLIACVVLVRVCIDSLLCANQGVPPTSRTRAPRSRSPGLVVGCTPGAGSRAKQWCGTGSHPAATRPRVLQAAARAPRTRAAARGPAGRRQWVLRARALVCQGARAWAPHGRSPPAPPPPRSGMLCFRSSMLQTSVSLQPYLLCLLREIQALMCKPSGLEQ